MAYVDSSQKPPAILSFCPGILGLERGLERAIGKLDIIAYVEIEAFIIANLVAQMESGLLAPTPIWTNVKTFNPKPFRGQVYGILGGYPCQPFSHAGERKGTDDPRHLWPYLQNCVDATRPFFCFFENVSGHLTLGFDEVYRSLRDMGYAVEAGIYTAEEVGAPHERERLFILAVMENADIVRWGGRYIEDRGRNGWEIQTQRSGPILDHSSSNRHKQKYPISAGRNGIEYAG